MAKSKRERADYIKGGTEDAYYGTTESNEERLRASGLQLGRSALDDRAPADRASDRRGIETGRGPGVWNRK